MKPSPVKSMNVPIAYIIMIFLGDVSLYFNQLLER